MTDYSRLPAHMRGAAQRYVEKGIPPGSFLTAVLSNDFKGAFARADDANISAMRDWAMWLYNDAPCGCQGSPESVSAWIKAGGMKANQDAQVSE